jgi:uncharacterized protein with PIN domain
MNIYFCVGKMYHHKMKRDLEKYIKKLLREEFLLKEEKELYSVEKKKHSNRSTEAETHSCLVCNEELFSKELRVMAEDSVHNRERGEFHGSY